MSSSSNPSAAAKAPQAPVVLRLEITRFRGIKALQWLPAPGVNVILGGGDVGKSTVLDAVALLLSPTYSTNLADTDYYARNVAEGFKIEAVMSLPPDSGIDHLFKPSWPWEWHGEEAVVPTAEGEDGGVCGQAVYRVRVRGNEDLELIYEIVQPDGTADRFPVSLRRAIGLVRLGGDDRNDRDLRLVQGSALDRLLSDSSLRSRMAMAVKSSDVKGRLLDDKKEALESLDQAFAQQNLPHGLDLSFVGGRGASFASMVGLTADLSGTQLPLATWGTGTRRLSALATAQHNQGHAPVTVVDEVERGLEPYRQRVLMNVLQTRASQVFATTHSPFVIGATAEAALWHLDSRGMIGTLDQPKLREVRLSDPGAFLSRLTVVAEGSTEVGFVGALLERRLGSPPEALGIYVCDGGGHERTLAILEELSSAGLQFAGFADDEGKHSGRWRRVETSLRSRLFRWPKGSIEANIIGAVPEQKLEVLLEDPAKEKSGTRRRTLAARLGIQDKGFSSLAAKAGPRLRSVMIEAATGALPEDTPPDRQKEFQKHGQDWFKTVSGGRELEAKLFSLGLWGGDMKDQLHPFVEAVRRAVQGEN